MLWGQIHCPNRPELFSDGFHLHPDVCTQLEDAGFPNVLNGTCASAWLFPKGLRVKGLVLRLVLRGDGGTLKRCDPEGGF